MQNVAPKYAWMNGKVIPWEECVLHGRTQAAFFAANVFEGIRGYWSARDNEMYVFRNMEHMDRLGRSMKTVRLKVPYSLEEIGQGGVDLLKANDFREDVHFVTVAYFGMGEDFEHMNNTDDTGVYITAVTRPQPAGLRTGYTAGVVSWRRISDDTVPPRVKAGANYHNSRLAHQEARRHGYNTAIILNNRGTVAEAPGACMMMVRDGQLVTPPVTSGILESITRSTLMELSERELGRRVVEREIDRTELYSADEVFLCGSGWEVMPIVAVDQLAVGAGVPGPVTRAIQDAYFGVARGENPAYRHWLTPVYGGVAAEAAPQLSAAR